MNEIRMPKLMKLAATLNIAGTISLVLSIISETPLQLVLTVTLGFALLTLGILIWLGMVIIEATKKGMFS